MAMTLSYNSQTVDITTWSESVSATMSQNGRKVLGYDHVLTCQGYYLNGADSSAKATDLSTIVAKFRESSQDITIAEGGNTVRAVTAASVQGTGPWSTFSIPETHPLKVGGNVAFTAQFRFITDPPTASGGTTADTYSDQYAYDKQLRRTYTRTGQLSTSSGTSAAGKFSATDPAPGEGWELTSKSYEVDDDDQNLRYTWVYLEQHRKLLTSALDENYTINSKAANGIETWSASGTLRFQLNTPAIQKTTVKEIAKLLSTKTGWPAKATIVAQDLTTDPRENTITFAITAEIGYGQGTTLEYEERITTTTEAVVTDHKAASPSGTDKRQTLAKPEVTITQTGKWRKQGSIPDDPKPVISTPSEVVVTFEVSRLPTLYATDGSVASEGKEWRIVMKPLNVTPAGSIRSSVSPVATNQFQGQKPSRTAV